ncbi:hypothetical protein AKJ52_02640 [candidate division MSBL1 archaeon SCGC-AAA382C18]|uniref:SpoVT-AbrB domain-containing protein n=1 Tax=candidate division MSBL1 archaeon SCGC-AAA382C18 TaxID=1698281 RepID=A0A133VHZ3_9EURY|nr:hypothetical protein AKJ52_02640 [candidate division MSBL1 archaeon SCGC-AAA382C18]
MFKSFSVNELFGIMGSKLLGTTKVTEGWKISLIKEVRKELNGGDVGDYIAYREKDGDIVIEVLD